MFLIRNNRWFYFLITLIIVGGVFFRFYQLNVIPPGVHYDEAYNGMDALWANESGDWKIFYPNNTGREGLHINVIAFFLHIFGNSNLGLRFANAMWGSLTLVGFFFLLRELKFSRFSVAVGTFMLTASFWHLVFSRTAYRAIMVPFVLVWLFYFLFKGLRKEKHRVLNLAVAGIFLGLGFNTYIAFRIVPAIILAVLLSFYFTEKKFIQNNWRWLLGFALGAMAVVLPLSIYFLSGHLNELVYRSGSVSVFNSPNISFLQAFSKSLMSHLNAFFVLGDANPRHNFSRQPLLPAAWSALFAIGFIISLREIFGTLYSYIKFKKNRNTSDNFIVTRWFHVSVLSQATFWCMLAPGVLTIEGIPHSLRIIGTIPAVFILTLLPLEYGRRLIREFKKSVMNAKLLPLLYTIIFGLIGAVLLGGISQIYVYFNVWSKDLATHGAYERKLYDLGLLIKDLPVRENNYLITASNTNITADHRQSSLKTAEFKGYPNSQKYLFYRPLDGFSQINCNDPLIVFLESDQWLRDRYRERCPGLKAKRYSFDNNKYLFWVMGYEL